MSTVNEVLSAAMALPPSDRAAIANRLFESLDEADVQPELHPEWEAELSARANAIVEGTAVLVDGESAVEELRRSLARKNAP
jgi:putative addiction module component (TIGR02574 family)